MSEEMLKRYEADPLGMDSEVRRCFKVPENRYYSVSTYPAAVAGRVTMTTERTVKAHKISKSDASTPASGSVAKVRTIADSIADYKATRGTPAVKLLHRVLDKIIGLKCPHCHGDVNITIESH